MMPDEQQQRNQMIEIESISSRQDKVALALASGKTNAEAARVCEVGPVTVYRWLKQPAFVQRIEELRHRLVDQAIGRLADMMGGVAADRLLKLFDSKNEAVRLSAIKLTFDLFIGITNTTEMKGQLQALLAQLEQAEAANGRTRQ